MVSKYKETEIGSIPEEWDVISLSDAFQNLEAGVSVNSDERQNADFFVLKTSAISDGLINIDEAKPVVKKEYARLKCPVKKGSIIISRMNTPQLVGACGYVAEDVKGYFLPDRLWQVVNSKPEKYDFRWLNYLLNQYRYKNAIHAVATGTSNSMKNISKERLLEIRIPRPSIEEQKFIVEAISDIEALIYDLEKLIKKKRNIFTGTMQMLVTGKKRLSGFDGNWRVTTLDQLCYIVTKQTGFDYSAEIKPSLVTTPQIGTIPFIQNKDFEAFDINYNTDFFIPYDVAEKYTRILLNEVCLLISISGRIGNVAIFDNEQTSFAGGAVGIAKLYEPELASWCMLYLSSKDGQEQIFSNEKVGAQHNLTVADVRKLEIKMPAKSEREAIIKVLTDMNDEIEVLEEKLDKYQKIKQGMMEELLTGKVRLV